MKIGIDVDDTITNTYEFLIKVVAEHYKMDYDELLNRNLGYDYFFNNDEFPDYTFFVDRKYDDLAPKFPIKEDASEYLNMLHEQGNEIVIITARHYGEYEDPYNLTFNYLTKNNIPFDKIVVGAFDKAKVVLDEQIDLFIDDSIGNCNKVLETGIDVLLFDARFNKNSELKRVNNWKDVYELINNKK